MRLGHVGMALTVAFLGACSGAPLVSPTAGLETVVTTHDHVTPTDPVSWTVTIRDLSGAGGTIASLAPWPCPGVGMLTVAVEYRSDATLQVHHVGLPLGLRFGDTVSAGGDR